MGIRVIIGGKTGGARHPAQDSGGPDEVWPTMLPDDEPMMPVIEFDFFDAGTIPDPDYPGNWVDCPNWSPSISMVFDDTIDLTNTIHAWRGQAMISTTEVYCSDDSKVPETTISTQYASSNANRWDRKPLTRVMDSLRAEAADAATTPEGIWFTTLGDFHNILVSLPGIDTEDDRGNTVPYHRVNADLLVDSDTEFERDYENEELKYRRKNLFGQFPLAVEAVGTGTICHYVKYDARNARNSADQLCAHYAHDYLVHQGTTKPVGILWSWFDTSDTTNFKVTAEPSYTADAVDENIVVAGHKYEVFLVPRRWAYYCRTRESVFDVDFEVNLVIDSQADCLCSGTEAWANTFTGVPAGCLSPSELIARPQRALCWDHKVNTPEDVCTCFKKKRPRNPWFNFVTLDGEWFSPFVATGDRHVTSLVVSPWRWVRTVVLEGAGCSCNPVTTLISKCYNHLGAEIASFTTPAETDNPCTWVPTDKDPLADPFYNFPCNYLTKQYGYTIAAKTLKNTHKVGLWYDRPPHELHFSGTSLLTRRYNVDIPGYHYYDLVGDFTRAQAQSGYSPALAGVQFLHMLATPKPERLKSTVTGTYDTAPTIGGTFAGHRRNFPVYGKLQNYGGTPYPMPARVWRVGEDVESGEYRVSPGAYRDSVYRCILGHTSTLLNQPGVPGGASYWVEVPLDTFARIWEKIAGTIPEGSEIPSVGGSAFWTAHGLPAYGSDDGSQYSKQSDIPYGAALVPDVVGSLVGIIHDKNTDEAFFVWRKTDEQFDRVVTTVAGAGYEGGYVSFEAEDSLSDSTMPPYWPEDWAELYNDPESPADAYVGGSYYAAGDRVCGGRYRSGGAWVNIPDGVWEATEDHAATVSTAPGGASSKWTKISDDTPVASVSTSYWDKLDYVFMDQLAGGEYRKRTTIGRALTVERHNGQADCARDFNRRIKSITAATTGEFTLPAPIYVMVSKERAILSTVPTGDDFVKLRANRTSLGSTGSRDVTDQNKQY